MRKATSYKLFAPATFCSVIALATLGLSLSPSHAAPIYDEDFATISAGWSIGTSTPGTISFAAGAGSGPAFPTRSLLLSHVPQNTTRLTSTMPSGQYSIARTSTDESTFQFDLRLNRTNTAGWIVFYDNSHTSQLPMFINVTGGNFNVGYWDGSANATLTLLSGYTVDTTYTFTFTTTPNTGNFSAEVTGGSSSLADGGFRRTGAGADPFQNFNRMLIYNDGGSASGADFDMYIDNIEIAAIPEPTAAVLLLIGLSTLAMRRNRKHRSLPND